MRDSFDQQCGVDFCWAACNETFNFKSQMYELNWKGEVKVK